MLRTGTFLLLSLPLLAASDDLVKPEKLTIHTWVREDLFAGYMVNDMTAFERGVRKLERFLKDNPADLNGLAWKYFVLTNRMKQARAKGDDAGYEKYLAEAKPLRARIFENEVRDLGPYIIVGESLVLGAFNAPEKDKEWMYRDGRDMLRKVQAGQAAIFDKLPPHFRGELWSSMAVASDRLGDKEDRDRIIGDMLVKLAGTPYEGRAKRWQKQADLKSAADNMCITCHEPGRLEPTLARLKAGSTGN